MATADVVSVVEGDEGPDNSASDNRHVKEISEVLADISNAANEYLLRGFDAFERYGRNVSGFPSLPRRGIENAKMAQY